MRDVLTALLLASIAACAEGTLGTEPETAPALMNERGLTAEQEAAYQQCLQDNMAVAMAWEIIEQTCLEEARGDAKPLQEPEQ